MLPKLKALVADSNVYLAGLTASMLRSVGVAKAVEVNDSPAALSALSYDTFDVIVLDDQLAPVSGIEFVRSLRAKVDSPNRTVPVVMLFTQSDQATIFSARDAGVTEFIRKPVSAQLLESRITNALSHPRTFVETPAYTGPDRRRRTGTARAGDERRGN